MNTYENNKAPNALDFLGNYLKKEDVLRPQVVKVIDVYKDELPGETRSKLIATFAEFGKPMVLNNGERLAREPRLSADDVVAGSPLASVEGADRRMARAVEVAATYSLRRQAAVLLAEGGIDLCIYGNDVWRTALAGTAAAERYRRPLDYLREVPAAYHYARVVVNIGSANAPQALNMRAFDVPPVRGCLITDNRPGVHLAFAADREIVVYDRIADLPEIVKGLLADHARRDAIAEAGRARVLRSHTYDRRWATMFAACTKECEDELDRL